MGQAAAAVSMGTYWAWEYCCVAVCSVELGASGPTDGGEGRGKYRGGRPPSAC